MIIIFFFDFLKESSGIASISLSRPIEKPAAGISLPPNFFDKESYLPPAQKVF